MLMLLLPTLKLLDPAKTVLFTVPLLLETVITESCMYELNSSQEYRKAFSETLNWIRLVCSTMHVTFYYQSYL